MHQNKVIITLGILALSANSCVTPITVGIINRSEAAIVILDHGKNLQCPSGEMVSFVPERTVHDIVIRTREETLSYDLKPTPKSFLDCKGKKRLLFDFGIDKKLYILEPTEKPLEQRVGVQPQGYPLSPQI